MATSLDDREWSNIAGSQFAFNSESADTLGWGDFKIDKITN